MRRELDELLCERYPLIFAQRTMDASCMSQGFSCADGWFTLIDALCECLQFDIDHNGGPQVVAVQVKEKLGALRFYVRPSSERQRGMIDLACAMSTRLCEKCGSVFDGKVCSHRAPGTSAEGPA